MDGESLCTVRRALVAARHFEAVGRYLLQGVTHGRKAANFLMQPTDNRAHCFRGVESGSVASHTTFVRVDHCCRKSASIFLAPVVFHIGKGYIGCDCRGKPRTATRVVLFGGLA